MTWLDARSGTRVRGAWLPNCVSRAEGGAGMVTSFASGVPSVLVQWAPDSLAADGRDMSIDHRGGEIPMAEQLLDGPDVVPRLQHVRGKVVSLKCQARHYSHACATHLLLGGADVRAVSKNSSGTRGWRRRPSTRGWRSRTSNGPWLRPTPGTGPRVFPKRPKVIPMARWDPPRGRHPHHGDGSGGNDEVDGDA
jgi:hypothetical protein